MNCVLGLPVPGASGTAQSSGREPQHSERRSMQKRLKAYNGVLGLRFRVGQA